MDYRELKIPNHVAIIMDGNGRWATSRGLDRSAGHRAGADALKKLGLYIFSKGIKYLSVYAFSTENFKRSEEEVNYLMNLFMKGFKNEFHTMIEKDIKVIFSGRREPLRKDVLKAMDEITSKSKNNKSGVFNICLNYGGHSELIDATKRIVKDVEQRQLDLDSLEEETFAKYLYQDLPPIDFLIRTSGEYRISNFMLWQLSYAEFYFPSFHFPDFTEERFDECILEYTKRDRRFGGITYENKNS